MTIFKYKTFSHPVNDVMLARHRITNTNSYRGHQQRRIETLMLVVEIETTGQSNFDRLLEELRVAYEEDGAPGQSAGLYWDDETPTRHVITATPDCINGLVVKNFDFLGTGNNTLMAGRRWGTELANKRTMAITIEAEYFALQGTGFGSGLIRYEEQIGVIGTGGPKTRVIEFEKGPPVIQTICQLSKGQAYQKGAAIIAKDAYFLQPDPLWGEPFYLDDVSRVEHKLPQWQRIEPVNYITKWHYQFEGVSGFSDAVVPPPR